MDDIEIDSATVTRKGVRFTVRRMKALTEGWEVTTQNPFTESMRNTGGQLKIEAPSFDLALSTLDDFAGRINEIGSTLAAADRLLKDTAAWCKATRFGTDFGTDFTNPQTPSEPYPTVS